MSTPNSKWAFNDAFLQQVTMWPPTKQLTLLRKENFSFSNSELANLKRGGMAKRSLLVTIITWWQNAYKEEKYDLHFAHDFAHDAMDVALSKIAYALDDDPTYQGAEGVMSWLKEARMTEINYTIDCPSCFEDCLEAANIIRMSMEKYLDLSQDDIEQAMLRHIGLNTFSLAQLLDRWRLAQDYSTSFTRQSNQRVGCTIVLSLTDDAYQLLRSGLLSDLDIHQSHLRAKTGNLFLFGFSNPFNNTDSLNGLLRTKTQMRNMMHQVSLLAPKISANGSKLRVLAIASHESNIKKLEKWGFVSTEKPFLGHSTLGLLELSSEHPTWPLFMLKACIDYIQTHSER